MPPKKKNAGGSKGAHALPPPIPEGEILTDNQKKQWKVGNAIGSGGFGLIYLASSDIEKKVTTSTAEYVLKIEPVGNGPLFCEINFYIKAAKKDMVESWKKKRKQYHLGIPIYIASGQHERSGHKYRFMIMQRFSTDLQKLFEKNNKSFKESDCFLIFLQVLDTLEYIHEKGYVHADIKASNLLIDIDDDSKVYLVDYGLATRYLSSSNHKPYKEDKRKCHDGTIEFTSLDAHRGADPSRRGDLEILMYCLIQWLIGKLPWEDKLTDKEYVMRKKNDFMKNIGSSLKRMFAGNSYLDSLVGLVNYIKELEYDESPDYSRCRNYIVSALEEIGEDSNSQLTITMMPRKRGSVGHLSDISKRQRQKSPDQTTSAGTQRGRRVLKKVAVAAKDSSSEREIESDMPQKKPQPKRLNEIKKSAIQTKRTNHKHLHKSLLTDDDEEENDNYDSESSSEEEWEEPAHKKATKKQILTRTSKQKKGDTDKISTSSKKQTVPKKTVKRVQRRSTATQTSPGLKGLKKKMKK
ncbi:DgyrCDS11423 [Dimorphilus gyrociliatus]|uniref:non-specific serine/threonine protein kinase n=1 Tax=Dimorphilus gyrociliatus TaxID=2664684 RepID=A0A7I8W7X0_9ANNE|nr:DgyrCDS11423 [Dimorphilus gyrociliatus]